MKIVFNSDKKVVERIQNGLKQTGGYCPCKVERSQKTKCMCEEFRKQIADTKFEGFCHCKLYYKYK